MRLRASRTAHESRQWALPPDRPLCLVVVADTHSQPHPASARHIASQKPDLILHAGDIGTLTLLDELSELAPTIAVRGNIDGHQRIIADSLDLSIHDGEELLLKLLLTHIAVYGPKLRAEAVRLAQAHGASLVVCGHSHVPFMGVDRKLVVFNPGSIGPRRFGLPITFGVMEVSRAGLAALRHIDCETGQRWTP